MKRFATLLLIVGLGAPALVQAATHKKSPHYHKPHKYKGGAHYSKQHKHYKKPAH